MTEARTDFDKLAAQWDQNPVPVRIALGVGEAIIRETSPDPTMDVLDFGCGTGLVLLRLQPLVKSVTGVDSSPAMLEKLQEKFIAQGIANGSTQLVDFEQGGRISGSFDLIVSSMTLHHVSDTAEIFAQWYGLLKQNGRVCFADLDSEDGSFHADNAGVKHFGFDRDGLAQLLTRTGFREVRHLTATTVAREIEGKGTREFPVFLIVARK